MTPPVKSILPCPFLPCAKSILPSLVVYLKPGTTAWGSIYLLVLQRDISFERLRFRFLPVITKHDTRTNTSTRTYT